MVKLTPEEGEWFDWIRYIPHHHVHHSSCGCSLHKDTDCHNWHFPDGQIPGSSSEEMVHASFGAQSCSDYSANSACSTAAKHHGLNPLLRWVSCGLSPVKRSSICAEIQELTSSPPWKYIIPVENLDNGITRGKQLHDLSPACCWAPML